MSRWIRFLLVLLPGLSLVGWGVLNAATRANRAWFEHDATARAQLVVAAPRPGLASHWQPAEADDIAAVLGAIARDERIMAAGACLGDGQTLAAPRRFRRNSPVAS